jgi:hypothetical protein
MRDEPIGLDFEFPLPRPLTGVMIGNGAQALMVWGDETLRITVGRAGFWDHRGGRDTSEGVTYAQIRAWLEAGDEQAIADAFGAGRGNQPGPNRPYQLGLGRVELTFPHGLLPRRATLDVLRGRIAVQLAGDDGRLETLTVGQSHRCEVAWIDLPPALADDVTVDLVPAWRQIGEQLAGWGAEPPELRALDADPAAGGAMVQPLPQDPAGALAWRRDGARVVLASALGQDVDDDPATEAIGRLDSDVEGLATEAERWWRTFWRDVPEVHLPDESLERMYRYGLWRLAGCMMSTTPSPVAAGLQGPFLEDTKLPPWSSDYHFNINVQMMYWPLLSCGLGEHFEPLWEMLRGWLSLMRRRGEAFFQARGALMLPHACDDRGQVVGSMWSGTIDHGCCAWMAQLAWLDYRYRGAEDVLRQVAWPLLNGAFEGYWAMAERVTTRDGEERLSLPVSVSPEYRGRRMDAWGRDASFQLAAFRCVAEILPRAAKALGEQVDPRWAETLDKTPHYTLLAEPPEQTSAAMPLWLLAGGNRPAWRIGLWAGQDLDESHRHHSHIACLWPFDTVDPVDPAHRHALEATIDHWVFRGAGTWTAWCLSWASILCSRMGYASAAAAWLGWLREAFWNEGDANPHSGPRGATMLCFRSPEMSRQALRDGQSDHEDMQMDGALGVVTAVHEMLVQNRRGVIHVLPDLPVRWRGVRFDRIRCEGGFLVGATVERNRRLEIRVRAERGGRLRLRHHLGSRYLLDDRQREGELLEIDTRPGQSLTLRPLSPRPLSPPA